ncbi:hypothetical protein NMG60_11015184 [Bertholletia excelsa]
MGNSEDQISDLPDPILVHILSFLDTEYAVRTSVLSRRWKHLWASVPDLIFHLNHLPEGRLCRFILFINQRVVLRPSPLPVDKFVLSCRNPHWEYLLPRFNTWLIQLLSFHHVRHLHIDTPLQDRRRGPLSLPPTLFTSETLVHLKLGGSLCRVDIYLPPSQEVRFPNLKTFSIRLHKPSDQLARKLFSNTCPSLQSLRIDAFLARGSGRKVNFDICAPQLRKLEIILCRAVKRNGSGGDQSTVVIEAPLLQYLSISDKLLARYSFKNSSSELLRTYIDNGERLQATATLSHDRNDLLSELVRGICNVKCLELSYRTTRALQCASNYGPLVFPNLTRLELQIKVHCSLLLDLLRRTPLLQFLSISIQDTGFREERDDDCSAAGGDGEVPGCLVSSLEIIQVDKFMGHKEIVDLVIYFLENSLVLNKLILYCQDLDSSQVEKLQTQLHLVTPGSKTCRIDFFRLQLAL